MQSSPESDRTPATAAYATANLANVVTAVRESRHPTQIGPYHILEPIGEGGMGTVYKAEQREPIHRTVALKIIKLGMDTRQVIARFESERQALAMMNHPNVAKVLDAGATESGRPYFVMEYVQGEPITTFADRHKLTVRQRLELFVQACHALQHAHQKAIIHRDLKPSNILVTLQDDKPWVKVIDFGVAKATAQKLTERTLFTESGQLVGTPEYMAPEQAESNALDVDTRSDVYSLGVVLYELLSGAPPFSPQSLRSAGYHEIQRIIREVDPPRPSTRLSTLHDRLPTVAALRQIEPAKLARLMRGELDWIVMKAMEKDRVRRYESANAFAADVQRYLADEPVTANPPSRAYRARKFMRRHKAALAAAMAILLALAVGLIGTTTGFIRAQHQRDQAIAARKAEAEAREYEAQTHQFLGEMFTSIQPDQARGREVLVKEILDLAARRIDAAPPTHRLVEASLRYTFGDAYQSLGLLERARAQLERALELYRAAEGPSNIDIARSLNLLGTISKQLGNAPQAESIMRQALDMYRALLGADHSESIAAQAALAVTLIEQAKTQEAEALLLDAGDRVKRIRAIDVDTRVNVINDLAFLRTEQGRLGEAESLLRDALAEAKTGQGEDHPIAFGTMNNLTDVLRQEGKSEEAVEMMRRSLELGRKVNGPDHPDTLTMANNVALALQSIGRNDEAAKLYLDTIDRRKRALGEGDPGTLLLRSNYGLLLQKTGRLDEADITFREVLDRQKQTMGENHQDTLTTESNIAWLRAQRGDFVEAERIYRQLLPRATQAFGQKSPVVSLFGMRLGYVLLQNQKWAEAEPLLARGYATATAMGVAAAQPMYSAAYGACLVHLNKAREALPVLQQADDAARAAPQPDPQMLRHIADDLAVAYGQLGQPEEAQRWREKAASQPASDVSAPR